MYRLGAFFVFCDKNYVIPHALLGVAYPCKIRKQYCPRAKNLTGVGCTVFIFRLVANNSSICHFSLFLELKVLTRTIKFTDMETEVNYRHGKINK